MLKKVNSKKELLILASIFTLIFYVLANGYRFFNPLFSGDSLLMIHHNDSAWQISLGRFVQPFLVFLRGGIVSPLLISVLALLWLSLSVYFLVDFLEIDRLVSIIFIAAVMTCNPTMTATNATYLHSVDFYALALFLSVFGVWLIKKEKLIFTVLGAISLSVSLGIYQAYICVAIALVMIHFIFKMMELPTFKNTIKSFAKYLISFAGAAIIYLVVWKIFQNVFNIWTADSYNGMSSLGDYSDVSIGSLIATTYTNVFNYFIHPETFTTIPFRGVSLSIFWVYILRFCNIAVFVMLLLALITKNVKSKTNLWQRIVQILIVVLFPFGINFVCIMSKGMEHALMIYAFCLGYILAIKATESSLSHLAEIQITRRACIPWIVVLSSILIISWSNIVYANQVYLKKDLQEKATHSLMTRIVYEIESTDDYIAGVTPVAFSGSFENTPYITDVEAFKDLLPMGMGKSPLTYVGTDYAYLTYILNVNMNLTRIDGTNETVQEMPIYPAKGSVAFVDDILVVKISE